MFDDSIPSHVKHVVPELTKRGFTGTFYINPGAGHYAKDRQAWEQDIPGAGFELANHTLTHQGGATTADIAQEIRCNEAIRASTPARPWPRLVSWGQPGGIKPEAWPVSKDETQRVAEGEPSHPPSRLRRSRCDVGSRPARRCWPMSTRRSPRVRWSASSSTVSAANGSPPRCRCSSSSSTAWSCRGQTVGHRPHPRPPVRHGTRRRLGDGRPAGRRRRSA